MLRGGWFGIGRKIPIVCIICGGHVKYYDPEKLKNDEDIEKAFGIKRMKISLKNIEKEGFVCYTCLGKILANEILDRASPRADQGLPSMQLSQLLGDKRG